MGLFHSKAASLPQPQAASHDEAPPPVPSMGAPSGREPSALQDTTPSSDPSPSGYYGNVSPSFQDLSPDVRKRRQREKPHPRFDATLLQDYCDAQLLPCEEAVAATYALDESRYIDYVGAPNATRLAVAYHASPWASIMDMVGGAAPLFHKRRITIVVVGAPGSGKSSFIRSFDGYQFYPDHTETIEATIGDHHEFVLRNEAHPVAVTLMEAAGSSNPAHMTLAPRILHGADAIVALLDVTQSQAFTRLESQLARARREEDDGGASVPVVIAASKSDLPLFGEDIPNEEAEKWAREHGQLDVPDVRRQISKAQLQQWCAERHFPLVDACSAVTGEGVVEAVLQAVYAVGLYRRRHPNAAPHRM